MSEGTHSTPVRPKTWKRKMMFVAAGTAAAILLGGVALQVFRAEDGAAQESTAAGQQGTARLAPTQRPMARVGSELVSWQAVADECVARYGKDVLENIINRAIIQQECRTRGVEVSEAEVKAEVNRIAKRFRLATDQWYSMLQAERGLSPQQYERDVIWPMLALKKLAGNQVKISPEDIDRVYIRDYGPRVQAKMIMLDDLRRAQEAHQKVLQRPDDFEKLAQEYSIEPNSRSLGGAIPPIRRYAGIREVEDQAFKLKPGEISPIVQAGFNRWVILKCEGLTKPVATLEEVRPQLIEDLQEEKVQEAVAKVFDELKKKTRVDNYLTNTVTGGNVEATAYQTAAGPGIAPRGVAPRSAVPTAGTMPAQRPQPTAPARAAVR